MTSRALFHIDGEVLTNGRINTTGCALLAAYDVLEALWIIEEERAKESAHSAEGVAAT